MKPLIIENQPHEVGNIRCNECTRSYPAKCACGGLIHAQFVRETWQNQTILAFACDLCGEKYEHPKHRVPFKNKKFTRRIR